MSYAVKADNRTEAELLASTRRTLAEADEVSLRTLGTLHGQTEQLERIQDDTEAIRQNLDQSDKLLKRMRPFGWLRDIFRADVPPKQTFAPSINASSREAPAAAKGASSSAAAAQSRGAARLAADDTARRASRQRPDQQGGELDQAYNDIDKMLDGLKHKSLEINRTLDHHNKMIPQIVDTVHREDERMQKQQREMKKRLG